MNMIESYKGIPPGKIIAKRLAKRGLTQRKLATEIGEHYQTMNAIIMGTRHLTIGQSLKMDKALGFPEGFFAVIQTYYQIALAKRNKMEVNSVPVIRKSVFWDIDTAKLDWSLNKDFIVSRVNQRGSKEEIEEVRNYYANR
ncbi:MAG: helix-turn-helix domain-containing protein [Bacteroidales bacterium]|nr:helix-turn-helix domain-containing protein [Bacteroidales bacterium]